MPRDAKELAGVLASRMGQARLELHMQDGDFAALMGVSRQTVWRWETNAVTLRAVQLFRLAEVLHKPLDWFFIDAKD